MMTDKDKELARGLAKRIKAMQTAKDVLDGHINDLAKLQIKDFHFLDHRVSTFWECEKSPIGMCVFNLNDYCQPTTCRYCGGPVERK